MFLSVIDILKNNKILVTILIVVMLLIALTLLWVFKDKKKEFMTIDIACIGVFSAFSIVLYFFKFNLPFIFPSFLEINFSLLPIIIIGYMLGPVEAISVVLIRAIIKVQFTSTFCVGEFADLLIGIPVALVTSLIYKKNHTKQGALKSLLFGAITWVVISIFTNLFINVPFFLELYCNGNEEAFVGALSIIPGVTVDNYMSKYILYAVIPFNTLLSSIVSLVTFLVYKKISILFNKISRKYEEPGE